MLHHNCSFLSTLKDKYRIFYKKNIMNETVVFWFPSMYTQSCLHFPSAVFLHDQRPNICTSFFSYITFLLDQRPNICTSFFLIYYIFVIQQFVSNIQNYSRIFGCNFTGTKISARLSTKSTF